ncbi:hypothetical protein [Duganella sp. HH105]|uniref:hypothetical protein n=1 Tax=Duganella sp. HH105 TaxID=1781067 RepID=UPI00114CE59A|nr:hypothetical protein [Duganella sp. HH105]
MLTAVLLVVGACSFTSHSRNSAFAAVQVGDTEAAVIARFGTQPSVRERPGILFARYASQPCGGQCAERLWFENRLSLDTEAWSVELDKNGRTINKLRWISP